MDINEILKRQRGFFNTGRTLSVEFRIKMLISLHSKIKEREAEIASALKADLGKSEFESYMCEIGLALSELTYMIYHTDKFAKPKRVRTPLAQFCASSRTMACPYGNVLIMSPWNYPFLLAIEPLTDAIAAGNTAVVKPSAYSPETSAIVKKIIEECFPPEYVAVVQGGRAENTELLNQKFDMIFFTGSREVGKEVLRKCAENLTPAVLELGGKCPCIVDESADIGLAARRIVFGKFLNCGQTCVAPDYILCQSSAADRLVNSIIMEKNLQFGLNPIANEDYGRIVNEKHFDRILGLINPEKVVSGGGSDRSTLKIEPTVMTGADFSDKVMQEEIFGPVLPILTYDSFDEIFTVLSDRPKPLAMYIFSKNKEHIKAATERLRFGGGCVNDVVIHLATSEMGFGGVGESGMGAYHGKTGFDAFSHTKSIVDKKTFVDLPVRYQPYYKKSHKKLLKKLLK